MKYLFYFILFIFVLACSKEEEKTTQDYLASYITDNNEVLVYGKIDVLSILNKADYTDIPKVSALLIPEVKAYQGAIDLGQEICFALEGPFDENGNPARLIAFARVKNQDSLVDKITSLGQLVKEKNGIQYAENNDFTIGIKEKVACFIIAKNTKSEQLVSIFDKLEKELNKDAQQVKLLNDKKDFLCIAHLANLAKQSTTNTKLSQEKIKELEALCKDGFVKSTVQFNKGNLEMNAENIFNKSLQSRLFFNSSNGEILNELKGGKTRLGLASNIDIELMEGFLKDFNPAYLDKIMNSNFQLKLLALNLNNPQLSDILNGKIGLALLGDPGKNGSFIPELNMYLGLGNKGNEVSKLFSSLAGGGLFGVKANASSNAIKLNSSSSNEALKLPPFAKDFGKNGIDFHLDLDGLDMQSFSLDDKAVGIYAIKNMYFYVNNKGAKLIINGRNPNQNILKQVINEYVKKMEKMVQSIN